MTDSLPLLHPKLALPETEAEKIRWLQLIRSRRVGPSTFLRLLKEYGYVAEALDALPEIARKAGVTNYAPSPFDAAEKEFAEGCRNSARLVCLGEADYPALLALIADPPPVLWLKGTVKPAERAVAIVGARNASSLGTRMTRLLARDIGAAGYTIVSGLARGIDTAAHLAALDSGTLAVMAGGVDRIYPLENLGLAEKIAERGLLLSEQPIGLSPQARHFPRRNRLISGLSQAVVVVEGAAKSGSLITAREALDQGREVMAVPGHPLDARASGCNMLIRDGATLVRGSLDVTNALNGPAVQAVAQESQQPQEQPMATIPEALELSRRILTLLGPSPTSEDQLIRDLNLPAQAVATQLVNLELDGKLARQSGGMLTLVV